MDIQTRVQIIADIQDIMDTDKEDKEFLTELLQEMQEAYQEGAHMRPNFFTDYGYTQEEIIGILQEVSENLTALSAYNMADKLNTIAGILEKEWTR